MAMWGAQASGLENIPHEGVFRGCEIFWINIESQIAILQSEKRNTKCCLSKASSLSDLENLAAGPWAQDFFEGLCPSLNLVLPTNNKDPWPKSRLRNKFLIQVKNVGCYRTQLDKILVLLRKSPYLCSVKSNKDVPETGRRLKPKGPQKDNNIINVGGASHTSLSKEKKG